MAQQQPIAAESLPSLPILAGEAWADLARQQLGAMAASQRDPWFGLLNQCATATGSKPTAKWRKTTHPYLQALGVHAFTRQLLQWFPLVDQPRTQPLPDFYRHDYAIADVNADILKGLVWLCADLDDTTIDHALIARALGQLAISAYRKIPGIGPRCIKLGNACIWALGQMPGEPGRAQLALLKLKVKFGTAQKGIEKALTEAAQRAGISRSDLEELTVPSYGLTDIGLRHETFETDQGKFSADLVITGTSSSEIRWTKPDGKRQKSVPKAVKAQRSEQLKALKQAAKDIQTMLPAQRDRIESLYLHQKTWDYTTWKQRYLDHPLIGSLTRRIIWQFESGGNHAQGIWFDGQLVDRDHHPIPWINDQTTVQLWHPITTTTEAIIAWRQWLMEHQIQQPFKQAHREIYLLTAAEAKTQSYSNRFAAHILKQHQFHALCGQRSWKNQLRLMVDDDYRPAHLPLPQWGLRAEFWVEGMGDTYGIDTNDTGTFLYLATDQVRFYPLDSAENYAHGYGGGYGRYDRYDLGGTAPAIPLEDIPALVFTEVMRDVDLFVGVASVGNDPNWHDGGPEGRYRDYWQHYSFGELSATAQTRRQVLENLVPRLKIGDRCHFQDKFLIVRGNHRTYKIHLGSGNILMDPNDQYLCIVPSRSEQGPSSVFLPFEGDRMMAVILSKALLLAADDNITDPTILSQIH